MAVKRNLIANLGGSAWQALMGLAFVPFYIKLMGVESYGIVGVFTSLAAMLAILDLGLSQAMTREIARLSAKPGSARHMADMARTLEVTYWAIALVVVAVIVLLSDFIAYHWLNPEQLSREALLQVLWIMALVIGLRWPIAIYSGGLNGLQRQVTVNVLMSIFASLQGAGALAVLWLIAPTAQAFFLWQALIALAQVATMRLALWRSFPAREQGKFRKESLQEVWRFAAGITGISLLATALTQLDKVLLSKLLSLSEFGYYVFAATIAGVVYRIIGPVFTAYYPRLTELVSKRDQTELVAAYHQGCQLMAVAILPAALVLAVFSREILELWTHNHDIVTHSGLLVSLLVVGNALNGLVNMPYALQLAHGWTRLGFYTNVVAVIILVPSVYFATSHGGAPGAAAVWIVLNSGYLLIGMQVMYRHLLAAEKVRWYVNDVAKPLLATLAVVGIGRMMVSPDAGSVIKIISVLAVFGLAVIGSTLSAGTLRNRIMSPKGLRGATGA